MSKKITNNVTDSKKNEGFLHLPLCMARELELSGNELLIYAMIYGFSKDGTKEFHGSADYIAKSFYMTSRTVLSVLKKLTDKGLIQKRVAGRYCNYTTLPMKDFHTSCEEDPQEPMKNLHTTYENISGVSMKDFHNNDENSSYHINSDIIVDINSGSSTETTTTLKNICKSLGINILDKQAQKAIDSGIIQSWLSKPFTYPEYITEVVQERCPNEPLTKNTGLFIKLLSAKDKIKDYPEWRKNKEKETAAEEKRRQKEAEEQERQNRINQAKENYPKTCDNCGASLAALEGLRGSCSSCGWSYSFNEEQESWEFYEHRSLAEDLKNIIRCKNTEPDF